MSNLISGNFPYLTFRTLDNNITGQVVKTGKCQIFSMYLTNSSGSPIYVKVYDTAAVPDETFTPIMTLPVFSNQTVVWSLVDGVNFEQGIAIRASTGPTDDDATPPLQYECMTVIEYLS